MLDNPFLLAAIISAGFTLALLVGFRLITGRLSRRWNKHRAETVGQWKGEGVEFVLGPTGGQFGGFESEGTGNTSRSIGFVAITDRDFRITRSMPSAEWRLTFKQIKGVSIQPIFRGLQAKKTPFIAVRFIKDGKKDKLGFQVKEYAAWADTLAEAAKVPLRQKEN